jgi:trimeric autotransporter adhesin
MVITSAGNVGINFTNPQAKMVVRINGTAYTFFNNTTGGWTGSSDRRLKKNISGIENALEKVMRVTGIRYDTIDETASVPQRGKYFGFIAQDLEPIFPEMVKTDRKGGKSVTYGSIIPVLVEAIKSQHKEIEVLRKEVKALKELK